MRQAVSLYHAFAVCTLLTCLLLAPITPKADPTSIRGAALASACSACHGPNGRSQAAIPALDRLKPKYFRKAMQAFQTDGLQGTVMNHIAKGMSESDIEAVTVHFAEINSP